jgi:Ulp1 family protease
MRDCKLFLFIVDLNLFSLFAFPEGESDSVDISTYERARLAPGVWLNDNLIDFYLK